MGAADRVDNEFTVSQSGLTLTDSARYQDLTGRAQITPRGVGVEGKQKGTHASIATADTHATAGT